jgi:hypothetical protein
LTLSGKGQRGAGSQHPKPDEDRQRGANTRRTTCYLEVEAIQQDLNRLLAYYNLERTHQGSRLNGRMPAQALREALGIEELAALVPAGRRLPNQQPYVQRGAGRRAVTALEQDDYPA